LNRKTVTYVSGTFVTHVSGPHTPSGRGQEVGINRAHHLQNKPVTSFTVERRFARERFHYSFHVLGILEEWTPYAANFKKV
jgi:hypothetical protein